MMGEARALYAVSCTYHDDLNGIARALCITGGVVILHHRMDHVIMDCHCCCQYVVNMYALTADYAAGRRLCLVCLDRVNLIT